MTTKARLMERQFTQQEIQILADRRMQRYERDRSNMWRCLAWTFGLGSVAILVTVLGWFYIIVPMWDFFKDLAGLL